LITTNFLQIKDAFAKAKEASSKQAKRAQYLELEADIHSSPDVPRVHVDLVSDKYHPYRDENRTLKEKLLRAAKQRRAGRSSGSGSSGGGAGTPASTSAAAADAAGVSPASTAAAEAEADAAAAAASDLQALAERWQSRAAFVVHHLEAWAGSRVALQQQLQEMLMHIVINYDLHLDPRISVRAYRLLVQNLAAHPPVKPAAVLQEAQPRQLLRNALSWNPMARSALAEDNKDAADAKDRAPMAFKEIFGGVRFSLLQNLVRNAVQLVTGNSNSACWNVRPPGLPQVSTGKALLLLWLVQLLQADAHVRLAVFEEHMASCKGLDAEEARMVKSRAASVLSESLLHKLMRVSVWFVCLLCLLMVLRGCCTGDSSMEVVCMHAVHVSGVCQLLE
jgi:cell division septum initiation protein DivIVA